MHRRILFLALASLIVVPACGDGGPAVPFTLTVGPEFVQGAVTGARTGVLVTVDNESPSDDPVVISATAAGASVEVSPTEIAAGEVAEVWVTVDPGTADGTEMILTITGTRGDLVETATRSFTVFAWEDDRAEYAGVLFDVFRSWLEANHPELGITAGTEFEGSFVAPGLLVVSHYLYLSDEWEIGLSWHVMIPPDDWAEIYLRPRGELASTLAFRLSSQAAALEGGEPVFSEVPAPTEVLR